MIPCLAGNNQSWCVVLLILGLRTRVEEDRNQSHGVSEQKSTPVSVNAGRTRQSTHPRRVRGLRLRGRKHGSYPCVATLGAAPDMATLSICMKCSAKTASSPRPHDPSNHPLLSGTLDVFGVPSCLSLWNILRLSFPTCGMGIITVLCVLDKVENSGDPAAQRTPWLACTH